MRLMKKVGIIGCGAIGTELADFCVTELKEKVELAALYDIDRGKLSAACGRVSPGNRRRLN